jgi:hypothetical protein
LKRSAVADRLTPDTRGIAAWRLIAVFAAAIQLTIDEDLMNSPVLPTGALWSVRLQFVVIDERRAYARSIRGLGAA